MSCGCNAAPTPPGTLRARAAICHLCIYAERDDVAPWTVGAVACTISGKSVVDHIRGVPCPKGKHPDAGGIVRFPFGMKRAGVPKEFRWLMRRRLTGPLPGCGCFVVLLRLRAWLISLASPTRSSSPVPAPASGSYSHPRPTPQR